MKILCIYMESLVPKLEELPETSISELAKIIFSTPPKPPKSQQILIQQAIENSSYQVLDIFEIFLTILMEGIIVLLNTSWKNMEQFNEDTLLGLKPWLWSLGFTVHVQKLNRISDQHLFNNYYCKTLLRCDPSWASYFDIKHIDAPYTFLLGNNSPYIKKTELNLTTLFAIFIYNDDVYKIHFNYYV